MKKINCEKCNREISKNNYKKHLNSCDGIKREPFKKLKKCPYCDKDVSMIHGGNHTRWCDLNPNKIDVETIREKLIQTRKCITPEIRQKQANTLSQGYKSGRIKVHAPDFTGKHHSEETKLNLSIKRKEWLKNNKDKHNWNYNKNKSIPCELIKKQLTDLNILYTEEYIPFETKFYSIDIAFPDKQIGIEINGNQHYNKTGKLTSYYQSRHDFFENNNWKIYEFHFSSVYNRNIIKNIIDILNKSMVITEFDYTFWILNPKTKYEKNNKIKNDTCILKQQKIENLKQKLLNSSINFSKIGWVGEAANIINCKYQKVNKWMKEYMLEFYNEKCFKRIQQIS